MHLNVIALKAATLQWCSGPGYKAVALFVFVGSQRPRTIIQATLACESCCRVLQVQGLFLCAFDAQALQERMAYLIPPALCTLGLWRIW